MSIRTLGPALLVGLLLIGGCNGNGNDNQDGSVTKQDTGGTNGDGNGTPDTVPAKAQPGDPCENNEECESNVCYQKTCNKACSEAGDCDTNQDCNTDDGQRLFCVDRTYDAELGAFCGLDGKCQNSQLKCIGGIGYASAYCTDKCETSADCPPQYFCRELSDKERYCTKRSFCARCLYDGMCTADRKCVLQGSEKFCATKCNKGSTECPMFAECKDPGDGTYVCTHKAGSCVGNKKLCDPCITEEDCGHNAMCLTYIFSHEAFCGQDCSSSNCPTGYQCADISTDKQCVPDTGGDPDAKPTCVSSLSPTMMPGDIMDDFAMVGYIDSDKDGSLVGEQLKVIKLSDFKARYKLIVMNISAGWCGPCKTETKLHAGWMASYEDKGLMIFQVLFDGPTAGNPEKPTVAFLDSWIKAYNAAGAVGIDPARNVLPYNTDGFTPANILINAKTREVLKKMGANKLETEIVSYLNSL